MFQPGTWSRLEALGQHRDVAQEDHGQAADAALAALSSNPLWQGLNLSQMYPP